MSADAKCSEMVYPRRAKLEQLKQTDSQWRSMQSHFAKTPVMGIFDRETRNVRCTVVPNVRRSMLQSEILKNITKGSTLCTDDLASYKCLPLGRFVHEVVDHEKEYVRGQVHTNGMENFWSLLKRGLKGTYVAVEPFHLDRYVDEQVFRFNHRKDGDTVITDSQRFQTAMSQIAGKRLTYAVLTGKGTDSVC